MPLRPGDGQFTHIEFAREPDRAPERRRPAARFKRPEPPVPPDIRRHGEQIAQQTAAAIEIAGRARQDTGLDPSPVVVVEFDSANFDTRDWFEERFGASVVDESMEKVGDVTRHKTVVQFPTDAALQSFRREITPYQLRQPQRLILTETQREKFFNSLQSVRAISAEERMGTRLKAEGYPDDEPFYLDVDLWRPDDHGLARELLAEFTHVCENAGGRVTDHVQTESLALMKVRCSRALAEQILNLDMVARADLPPKIAAGYTRFFVPVTPPNPTAEPDETDALACVLDSGVVSGHPLLAGWVMAERDFDTGENTEVDLNGHGTSVAGLVVYGNVSKCLELNDWQPKVRICSAKILRSEENPMIADRPQAVFPDRKRVEGTIEEAIRYFHEGWGCRIFNLSVGDDNEPYRGDRQFPWAEKLDELARELDIVIVVAAGNRYPEILTGQTSRKEIQEAVLRQTLTPEHRICNPATSALALTVGSLARNDAMSVEINGRTIKIDDAIPGAPKHSPSPFTRTGPGCTYKVANAPVKPDLVDYGGNLALKSIGSATPRWIDRHFLVGELTIQRENGGRIIGSETGTSFACPHITHAAAIAQRSLANSLGREPSANLIRALVASTAETPPFPSGWIDDEEERLRLIGYGLTSLDDVVWSKQNSVRLVAMDEIEEDRLHIYQIPLPSRFVQTAGDKGIQVALAYDPPVRRSRKEYLARTMWVDVFKGLTAGQVENLKSATVVEGEAPVPTGSRLKLRPPLTDVQWSTLQVRSVGWKNRLNWPESADGTIMLHVVVCCQKRFDTGLEAKQGYGLVVNLWHDGERVRLYQPLRARLRSRARLRMPS